MDSEHFEQVHQRWKSRVDTIGNLLIEIFHYLALFVIGASVVWSGVIAYGGMMLQGHATIGDILLLFIYLELGAMVGIYFKTNAMPVRCLIYIAITALARLVIADVQAHHEAGMGMLWVSAAILLLAIATRVIRKPPSESEYH
ncbi:MULTISPECIES: phosphate-starvation-inducible protein PsiE [Methylomonas]|uniref:Protein PsiE n=2 Tax=Methylomonas TaxID=416 RepID=A0A140E4T8_9GAMM|nr:MULTISPECIES: phosphate-starvation-inducible PsiE family protein [Methylomonas]AMK75412.1 phosphate-starvation-inducible E [Methylomonas denitrificans]OAI01200.1 phosphate-starvation-inducible E [Methylomonas methanica]TCV78106.1 phosphate starvation-inducible membrane PsiE [Methylomonas methanica]